MPPLVSICLPVFNGQKHLTQAIDSVLLQTLSDFELLIADDFSEDASSKIIQEYASRDSRIRILNKNDERLGLFNNYNYCMSEAKGSYLKLFAQDDILEPSCIEQMARVLDVIPAVSMVACERFVLDEETGSRKHIKNELCPGLSLDGKELVFKSLITMHNYIGEPATVMLRKDSLDGGFDTAFHHLGDLEYWLRLSLSGTCYFLDRALCCFRIHAEGQSNFNKRNLLYMPDFMRLAKQFKDTLLEYGFTYDAYTNTCLRIFSETLEYSISSGTLDLAELGESDEQLKKVYSTREKKDRILEDLVLFRELAARSMCTLAQERGKKEAALRASRMQELTTRREERLRTMLQSASWKSTKWLRDLRKRISGISPKQSTGDSILANEQEYDDQLLYLMYLRRTISGISRSRSWKVTSAFRQTVR